LPKTFTSLLDFGMAKKACQIHNDGSATTSKIIELYLSLS
jgi:hypothetical protein